uniref:Alpha-2-macroglobulin bait region domain-containing protein n=1 Tax=Amphiprion percula TaxID=161767 RepID=A0A3P8S0D9_AMPPE
MGHPGIQTWTWAVYAFWMCVNRALAGPQYVVTFPAVLEAGAQTKLCASLMQPNETLLMTVTLMSELENTTLLQRTSSADFHECSRFTTPAVLNEELQNVEVKVRGYTFYSREVKKVMIKAYKLLTFVQTDKPIYLPGQTVHFRVVTLDTKFRPADQLDPNKNRIGQWLNEASNRKIVQLSYSLNSEAREGIYQVIVSIGEDKIHHTFKVEKFVLPKFDITLNVSEEVSIGDQEINAKACANYTFRQPVPGYVTVEMCRPLNRYLSRPDLEDEELTPLCHIETKQADNNGCATFAFKMSTFTKIAGKALQDVLNVSADVEEEGTGILRLQKGRIKISYVIGKLSFFDTPKIHEPGSVVEGKVKAVHYNNAPIPDMPVYLFEGETWSSRRLQNLTTDSSGVASFSLSTENLNGDIRLHVSKKCSPILEHPPYKTPFYESGSHTLSMSRPPSLDTQPVSFLKVKTNDKTLACDAEADITIQYVVVGERQDIVDIMYLVLSRGAIVDQGHKQVQLKNKQVNEGEVSFKLLVSPEMAPEVQIVAFVVLPSENVIAHSADFSTENCFSHKVSLEFSPSSAVPGEDVNMQLTAKPNSLCGVSAIDQSVLIKEPGKTLNAEKIFRLLPVRKVTFIPYQVKDPTECLHVRPKRSIFPFPGQDIDDAHTVFENVGLKVATNLLIEIPSCLQYRGREYHHNRIVTRRRGPSAPILEAARGEVAAPSSPDAAPIEIVRTFFPETWIWDLVEVGSSGTKNVSLTVPDTITTWETETFCLSPHGFGLAPRKEITVFQPFFLELTLPYSITRGERFELKATVFNYLSSCIVFTVTPELSSDDTLTPLPGYEYTICLCGNERETFSWTMNPKVLGDVNVTVTAEAVTSDVFCNNEMVSVPDRGRIDIVTKTLIVKVGTIFSLLNNCLCLYTGSTLTEEIELQLPEHVIEGSARALVSVLGDILGRALKNIDGLLRMPYGCGEQNMALLAPNIYILQYLKYTEQLTPAIREKASNFMTSGYQRQLNYKHQDGAYSTFGAGTGNTWLTAFVLRSFAKAKSFIYIDPTKIEQSRKWLESKQRENGCFEMSGKLFHNRMKGGVSDEVTLSAYVTAAFLEMNVSNPVVKKSLSCLKESISDLSNTYTTALMAYVFTLAGDMETRGLLLDHLDKVAIKQGGFLHWSQKAAETSTSLSVEISSYVLMAKLSASPTYEDLGYASGIVRWLTRQQNYYGGFSSTQDTVVALQALALYATLVFSPQGSSTVKVQSPSEQLTFNVNQDNRLLYQERILQDVTGKFSLEVQGTACASVQISHLYNVPPPAQSSDFTKVGGLKRLFSYKSSTNMVILDIQVLSGFVPDSESLRKLKVAKLVDRVEQKDGGVQVYIRELPQNTAIFYTLELREDIPVQNLKPAVVKIYDYYHIQSQTPHSCVSAVGVQHEQEIKSSELFH